MGTLGLYDYNARWYDPAIGRFIQPDPIVPNPGNPQDLNRYSYVRNNPLRYTDPSGRWLDTIIDLASLAYDIHQIREQGFTLENTLSLVADAGSLLLPVATGGGALVRAVSHADEAVDVARGLGHADEALDAVRAAKRLDEALDAVSAAKRLREVGLHADEAADLIKTIARQSTRGSGERVVIGKWIKGGGYIAEAEKHGGIYFATDPGVWEALGKNDELAWAVNEQFLRNQLEAGVSRIDLVGESVEEVLEGAAGSFRWREIKFLQREAANYGYKRVGNSWIRITP